VKKKVPYVISLLLVVLLVYGIYLFNSLRNIKDFGISETRRDQLVSKDLPPGELGVENVENTRVPFKQISLNNVWVNDFRRGDQENIAEVELGFVREGSQKYVTIKLAGEVNYGEYINKNGKPTLVNKKIVPVESIELTKGEYATVVLVYFSSEDYKGQSELVKFCNFNNDTVCLAYLKLGFGSTPVDGNAVNSLFSRSLSEANPSQFAVAYYIRNFAIPAKNI
jgi:hypothetical protein